MDERTLAEVRRIINLGYTYHKATLERERRMLAKLINFVTDYQKEMDQRQTNLDCAKSLFTMLERIVDDMEDRKQDMQEAIGAINSCLN